MSVKLSVVYEDDQIIAFNKPSGLLSIPDRFDEQKPCILRDAEKIYGKLFVVHRIDKDTSGLILFAKNETAHKFMSQLFEGRSIEKYYKAIVFGNPHMDSGSIEKPIAHHPVKKGLMIVHPKGKTAHTDFEVEQKWNGYALLQLQIFTGRTHQIRVHLHNLGYPVLCDPLYGHDQPLKLSDFKKKFKLSQQLLEEQPILQRLALHAYRVVFTDAAGQKIEITAPLSKDMDATIKQLSKWAVGTN